MKAKIELTKADLERLLLGRFSTSITGKKLRVEGLYCYFYESGEGTLSATITDEPSPLAETEEPRITRHEASQIIPMDLPPSYSGDSQGSVFDKTEEEESKDPPYTLTQWQAETSASKTSPDFDDDIPF